MLKGAEGSKHALSSLVWTNCLRHDSFKSEKIEGIDAKLNRLSNQQ
jgi:hypothetical protein